MLSRADIQAVSPAIDQFTQERLLGEVWKRPGLNPRDRSVITLAALIARNQTIELPFYLNRALDSGVKPSEISEIITHLSFYAGWPNAMAAVAAAKDVFAARDIRADQLPADMAPALPLDEWQRPTEPRASKSNSGLRFPALCNTRPICSSVICGSGPALRHATAASSQ